MFETRLKVLLLVWGIVGIAIVGRLAQLQLVRADYYQRRAERALHVKPKQMPFVRGSILDRTGRILVNDEPSWDLEIDYAVLAVGAGAPQDQIRATAKRWQKRYPNAATVEQAKRAFLDEIDQMWADIAEQFSGDSGLDNAPMLRDRAREIYERVQRIRDAVAARRGFDCPVFEETIPHPVVTGLDAQDSIAARETLGRYPWAHVASSSVRDFAGDGMPFAHVLGRLGRVSAETVAEDPLADDPFARYLAHERVGITGVEYAAEYLLRGRRGQVSEDRNGNVADDIIEAEDGKDVTITLHAGLQRRLHQLLGEVIQQIPESSGGAMVVLDIPTREVLALVSSPAYDPNRFNELYPDLRRNTTSLPLRFRAVANQYAPGSIVKPLACLAGFMSNEITLDTRFECTGRLFPEVPNRWRCWQIHGTSLRKAHGMIGVEEALTGSCNVFMYKLGERIGIDGLCSAFDMVGVGRSTGIGLREEATGVNPTPGWLNTHKNTPVYPAHARLFAIGQGEILVTPIQLANLMAVYASGCYRPLTLLRTGKEKPEWTLPVTAEQWRAVRQGIYGVVNDPEGTAYKYARFDDDRYVLCGKTGSATAHPWPTSYRISYRDEDGKEQVAIIPAGSKRQAVVDFIAQYSLAEFDAEDVAVASRWPMQPPPEGTKHSHAWFAGYLQKVDANRQPVWSEPPRLAFAILVEFGGSGGRTSGPLAKRVAAELLDTFGPDLDVDRQSMTSVSP